MAQQESPKFTAQKILWGLGSRSQALPACSVVEGDDRTGGINCTYPNDFNDHLPLHDAEFNLEPIRPIKMKADERKRKDMKFHNQTYEIFPLVEGHETVIPQ